MKLIISAVFFSFFSAAQMASAAPSVCQSVQDCKALIKTASLQLQEFAERDGLRIAPATRAEFHLDLTVPALGNAYRDPSGLIWGEVVKAGGKLHYVSQEEAMSYCDMGGARLPTREELEELAKYMGAGTAKGYSAFLADGKTELLAGMLEKEFWSSTLIPQGHFAYALTGTTGVVKPYYLSLKAPFRCVSR